MKRSRVFLPFDLLLVAALVLPLAIAAAVASDRAKAATVYGLLLALLVAITWATKRRSHVSLRDYLRAMTN
jgi:MFS superfamily sulfate permease-like transporter